MPRRRNSQSISGAASLPESKVQGPLKPESKVKGPLKPESKVQGPRSKVCLSDVPGDILGALSKIIFVGESLSKIVIGETLSRIGRATRSAAFGLWTLDLGLWFEDFGLWTLDFGL